MYIKQSNLIIYLALSALVGFGVSFAFNADSSQTVGDIAKASRYNNQKVDPETSVIEEKLQNDESFRAVTRSAMDVIKNRVSSLEALSATTLELCDGIEELQASLTGIKSLNAKAVNTGNSIDEMGKCLDRLAEGKSAPAFEDCSNSTYIGFQKIENQMGAGKAFVESAEQFLINNDEEKYKDLTDVVALWAVYCAQDAVMNDSESETSYWKEKMANAKGALGSSITEMVSLTGGNLMNVMEVQNINNDLKSMAGTDVQNINGGLKAMNGELEKITEGLKAAQGIAGNVQDFNKLQSMSGEEMYGIAGSTKLGSNSISETVSITSPLKAASDCLINFGLGAR